MGHPDSHRLLALLDGEIEGVAAQGLRSHLAECTPCREALGQLETASSRASLALPLLDVELGLEGAAHRFQMRRRERAEGSASRVEGVRPLRAPSRSRLFGTHVSLPRAASIALLLTAAVASALPGSPARRWAARGWEALTRSTGASSDVETLRESPGAAPEVLPEATRETGVSVPVQGGSVAIWIHRMPLGAELRILWVEEGDAWVYAGEATRFNRSEGTLEAFGPPGSVRVEIPRNVGRVTVGLDGEIILRKLGEQLEILGPVQSRTPSEIRFGPSGSPNDHRD